MQRLLTFNCHEAWVHQLDLLGEPFDIVDGLPGRYVSRWDERMRPVPTHGRLISLEVAQQSKDPYRCIIGHNLTDLLNVKQINAPRVLVLHVTLEHRIQQAGMKQAPAELAGTIRRYLELSGSHVVAVTDRKRASWGLGGDVVESAASSEDYRPWSGHLARGLRVANQIQARRQYLYWDFHCAAFGELPVDILGHNPDMPGVAPAATWDELKHELAAHRFFVHTADPQLEDGFNMALIEALAAGLPVVGNCHPSSPIEHGKSGFLSDDPVELASYAQRLLDDHDLARTMSGEAQRLARERFGKNRFVEGFRGAIECAREKWASRA